MKPCHLLSLPLPSILFSFRNRGSETGASVDLRNLEPVFLHEWSSCRKEGGSWTLASPRCGGAVRQKFCASQRCRLCKYLFPGASARVGVEASSTLARTDPAGVPSCDITQAQGEAGASDCGQKKVTGL